MSVMNLLKESTPTECVRAVAGKRGLVNVHCALLTISLLTLLLLTRASRAVEINKEALATAIYISEGGKKTRWPYGIMLPGKPPLPEGKAREICLITIATSLAKNRHCKTPDQFIVALAATYCPKSTDPVGHSNWIKNVTHHYKKLTQ